MKEEKFRNAAKKLDRYVEHICKKDPEGYVDRIRKDIKSPDFEDYIDEKFGDDRSDGMLFDDPTYEEEIEKFIDDLKVEKGF